MKETSAKKAKALGLKSLTQVSDMAGRSTKTLDNWNKDYPELFEIVLLGCVAKLRGEDDEIRK